MIVRLQKYLADKGVASRRACEKYILDGLIKVNGKVVTELGTKVDTEKDRVEAAPELNMRSQRFVYIAMHKPVGYVCSVTGPEEPKIVELVKSLPERLFPVGRLDKLTAGLLLMTNDGRFAYELTHPKFEKEKEYSVKVREKVSSAALSKLTESFFIHGQKTLPPTIMLKSPHRFHVILREGRNRQIRRMCERANLTIEKLKRIRIGTLLLGDIAPGEFRPLSTKEIQSLVPSIT